MCLLNSLTLPNGIKSLDKEELVALASEVRSKIVDTTSLNGGHLASSLGAVDAIIAMLYSFDFEKDKVIFDVGHQSYAYKILTDRRDSFSTLRQDNGISGFPMVEESKYDSFTSGHAGDSLAAALGYSAARDKFNLSYNVITFIGDASFVNGENLEAIFSQNSKPNNFLIILNDNGMSISKNVNGLSKILSSSEAGTKAGDFNGADLMRDLGITYYGIYDGHDIGALIDAFDQYKKNPVASLIHIKTVKGKGYLPAETAAEYYHGVSKDFVANTSEFSAHVGEIICDKIAHNDNVIAVVAGMEHGTGTEVVHNRYPDNFVDVGISEDFAVTYAAGLARGGLRPIVCIYSTFLQRAYDQIVTNVCAQNLPVIFMIDRAGVTGGDGVTHQGVFDTAYLSHVPNMTVLSPKDVKELDDMLNFALTLNGPVAIRYPNGSIRSFNVHTQISSSALWEIQKNGLGKCILAFGARALQVALEAAKDTDSAVINARACKPIDEAMLSRYLDRDIITIEDGCRIGGFGSIIALALAERKYSRQIKVLGISDNFVKHGSQSRQFANSGLTADGLRKLL